jgi:hypothetical protein
LLVRPDGHVGFRAATGVPDSGALLERALDAVLSRRGAAEESGAVALEARA